LEANDFKLLALCEAKNDSNSRHGEANERRLTKENGHLRRETKSEKNRALKRANGAASLCDMATRTDLITVTGISGAVLVLFFCF
jgi:hypothetical protein